LDGLFQVLNAEECAQTNTLARQLAKPAFHQVQPTGAGGYKCSTKRGCFFSQVRTSCFFVRANTYPSPDAGAPGRETLRLSAGEISGIPDVGVADNIVPPP